MQVLPSDRLAIIGRLLQEAPDDKRSEMEDTKPLRTLLLKYLERDNSVSRTDRAWAVAALGGCGTLREARRMADLLGESCDDLVCTNIATIVARLHLLDVRLTESDAMSLWDMVHVSPWIKAKLLRALLLHREFASVTWSDELLDRFPEEQGFKTKAFFRDRWQQPTPHQVRTESMTTCYCEEDGGDTQWGLACALFDATHPEASSRERAKQACVSRAIRSGRGLREVSEHFDQGYKMGQRLLLGEAVNLGGHLDPESYLYPFQADAQTEDPLRAIPANLEPRKTPQQGLVAAWDFALEKPIMTGSAAGVFGRGTRFCHAGNGHRRLSRSGYSAVRVVFNLGGRHGPLWVEITHLAASRSSFPHEGTAGIQLVVDEQFILTDKTEVVRAGFYVSRHLIPDSVVSSRKHHSLTLRLVDNTTTYWLREIRIVSTDP